MRVEIEAELSLYCICGRELKSEFREEEGLFGFYELRIEPCICGRGVEDKIEAAYQRGLFESRDVHFREGYDKGYHDGFTTKRPKDFDREAETYWSREEMGG